MKTILEMQCEYNPVSKGFDFSFVADGKKAEMTGIDPGNFVRMVDYLQMVLTLYTEAKRAGKL